MTENDAFLGQKNTVFTAAKHKKGVFGKFSSQKLALAGKNWENTSFDKIQQNEKVNTFYEISSKSF